MTVQGALTLSFVPLVLWALVGLVSRLVTPRELPPRIATGILTGLGALVLALLLRVPADAAACLASLRPFFSYPPVSSLVTALSEETARLAACALALALLGGFGGDKSRQRVLWFGLLAGLSMAAMENLWFSLYMPGTLALRTLLTVPIHGAAGILAADALAPGKRTLRGPLTAAVFHWLWDFFLDPSLPAHPAFRLGALFSSLGIIFAAFIAWNLVPPEGE